MQVNAPVPSLLSHACQNRAIVTRAHLPQFKRDAIETYKSEYCYYRAKYRQVPRSARHCHIAPDIALDNLEWLPR
jgi:hypothetical protein